MHKAIISAEIYISKAHNITIWYIFVGHVKCKMRVASTRRIKNMEQNRDTPPIKEKMGSVPYLFPIGTGIWVETAKPRFCSSYIITASYDDSSRPGPKVRWIYIGHINNCHSYFIFSLHGFSFAHFAHSRENRVWKNSRHVAHEASRHLPNRLNPDRKSVV